MAEHLRFNLLPLKRHSHGNLNLVPDEARPALDPDYDPFSTDIENPTAADVVEEVGPYHHSNMKFWGYMLVAFIVIVLATAAVWTGSSRDWWQSLDLPPLVSPELIIVGNVFFTLFISYIAYHINHDYSSVKLRQGAIFFLVASYLLLLAWTAELFGSESSTTAAFWVTLLIAFMAIALWVVWKLPGFENKRLILAAASVWLIYLLYVSTGITTLNKNNHTAKDCKTKYRKGM